MEFYYQQGLEQGGRVRERLRDGVESAIKMLGNGFLQHPKNYKLRATVREGSVLEESRELYRQLLRLIYRLLFLMVAESRRLLLMAEESHQGKIYNKYYSIQRLRGLAEIPRYRREGFMDIWEGLKVTFSLFDENWHGKMLGLSPLNGDLFGSEGLADLNGAAIDNYDVLMAIKFLSLYEDQKQIRRVNYAGLDVEELGGTAGIITIEDIIEEIFGEIDDEYDTEELVETRIDDHHYIFSGRHTIEYLNETYDLGIPDGDYETLGGYIISIHGNIPEEKEVVLTDRFELSIRSVKQARIS